jgi:hypothetical protein
MVEMYDLRTLLVSMKGGVEMEKVIVIKICPKCNWLYSECYDKCVACGSPLHINGIMRVPARG